MKTNVKEILRWTYRVPANNIFFLVGPLVKDNLNEAREIIEALPEKAWLDVKPLTKAGIPGIENIETPSEAEIESLRNLARKKHMTVTDYFGCRFRIPLNRPFYKAHDASEYVSVECRQCENRSRCFQEKDKEQLEISIRKEAAEVGLKLDSSSQFGPGTTLFACETPTSRGDETYLSELFNHRVLLSSVPDGSQGGSFCLEDEDVHKRWERTGMFPTSQLEKLAEKIIKNL